MAHNDDKAAETNKEDYRDYLRPEAGPVPYEKLQRRAQEALNKIIGNLSAAARTVQVLSDDATIDTNRSSRIFFVSGEPGSGKSTLYLTLKAMLSEKEVVSEKYRKGCNEDLRALVGKGAVRWLDTLDLEVAGDEGENLLAAVLVRLIEELDKPDSAALSEPCKRAIKDLEELATDIGIAWEGNLKARAGELDPDTYSVEVMRTQRARLGVNERLRKALDDLAKHGCYDCDSRTLFVLPVDDFYLKPDASLQLLRLLRMISIPRLFFLVMGDITTVEALFVEKSLADWTAVAGAAIFAALPNRLEEALARARELRARYLRKLLPPLQRAVIEVMDWNEALEFKPERLDGKETNDADTLKDLLRKRNLDHRPASSSSDEPGGDVSLLAFLLSPPLETGTSLGEENKEDKKRRREAQEAYTALQLLDATPREVMDLWFALRDVRKRDDDPLPLLSLVENFVRLVIEEQNFLNEQMQETLSGVLPTRHYSPEDIDFKMNRLRLETEPRRWENLTPGLLGQLLVRKHPSWNLTVERAFILDSENKRRESDETKSTERSATALASPFDKLPPRPTAWIVLLHDLAWEWNPDSVNGNLVESFCRDLNRPVPIPQPSEDSDVVSKYQIGSPVGQQSSGLRGDTDLPNNARGWAIWYTGNTYKHLPFPGFKTFKELDRFLYAWSKGIEWLDKLRKQNGIQGKELVNKVIDIWSVTGSMVIENQYEKFAAAGDKWFKEQLEKFEKDGPVDEQNTKWREDLGKFKAEVLLALESPEINPN